MSAKHTPGPWAVEEQMIMGLLKLCVVTRNRKSGTRLAQIYSSDMTAGQALANANVMAAAPEMLSTIRLIRQRAQETMEGRTSKLNSIIVLCDTAIARAEEAP